jgi:hypothetical protein
MLRGSKMPVEKKNKEFFCAVRCNTLPQTFAARTGKSLLKSKD